MKRIRKGLALFFTFVMLFTIMPIGNLSINAASYSDDWTTWSQGASDDAYMRAYGCWVVAQARLIRMLGIDTSSTFNPDVYLEWERNAGHINSGFYQVNGDVAPVDYAASKGKQLTYKGIYYSTSDVWNCINNGDYGIICVSTSSSPTGSHWMLLDNEKSANTGTIYCYDSWSNSSKSRSLSLSSMSYTFYSIYTYGYNTHTHNYTEYVYYWESHPHYKCYKCSCGEVVENKNEPTFLSTCDQCLETVRPEKPTFTGINELYYSGENVTFRWNECKNTTHYNFWLYRETEEDIWETHEHTYSVENGFSRELPTGRYRAVIQAYNSNYWEIDHSDWLHRESDYVYFNVAEFENTAGKCGDNLTWTFSDDTLIISGSGAMTNFADSTDTPWYEYCDQIEKIVVEDGVTNIGSYAFSWCRGLTSTTIPDSVTSIGDHAFSWCSSLTSITIPDSVTSIGAYSFWDCSGLTNVTIPDSVTSIGAYAFHGCSSLTSITIPDSVTSIGSNAFSDCTGLTSITIPDSVTSIGSGAFSDCTGLTSITIPDSVTSIGAYAFYGCSSLTSITIPDSVTNIGDYAFWRCSSLTSIIIPDSVTSIGDSAFDGCSSLTSITIPDSVTSIGAYSFWGCSSLTSITIPDNVTSIGACAFSRCSSLTSIGAAKGNTIYHSDGNCIIDTAAKTLMLGCINSSIPDDGSVTSIGAYAFDGCSSLTSITIPDSVTSIGAYAFLRCSSLTSITIPDSVTSIGGDAFSRCSSLTSITIPDSVTNIGDYAFYGCSSLTSITIPDSVTSIGGDAFDGCSSLTSITIPDSVTSIGAYAFSRCSSLTSITIPDSVTSIGAHAFSWCSSLTSITIPDSVTSIGAYSFWGCSSLMEIIFKGSAPEIGREVLNEVTATAYYPASDSSWTAEVRESFGGDITWIEKVFNQETIHVPIVLYGDANGDGTVSINDVILIRKYLAELDYDTMISAVEISPGADANGDGTVNINDAVLIRKYLAEYDYDTESSSVILGPQ